MAKKDTTEETNLSRVASQYRQTAGLEERTSDEPRDLSKGDSELTRRTEPEGGYGGKDGITNNSALNSTEEARAQARDEAAAERAEKLEKTGLSGGETATQEALVTGSDVTDVKPQPETTPEEKKPAKGKK